MSNTKTLIQKYKEIQRLGTSIPVPWEVHRIIGCRDLHIMGDNVEIGHEGDFCSIEEARAAVAWYVKQLGGTVKWDK